MIVQNGNTTALTVPDLYISVLPAPNLAINGVASNILGQVGTATWGPVNSPVTAGNPGQAAALFGPAQNRKYDLMTAVTIANQQGANNFELVRVTDGTDVAASVVIQTSCLTASSKYTGTFGNGIALTVSPGTAFGTYKATVSAPNLLAEVFDNIGAGLASNALWIAIANAITNGNTAQRGPSNIITASAGAGTAVPASATYALTGGTDGVGAINGSVLLGVDGAARSGMYALRSSGAAIVMLADCDDSTTWATQLAYGLSEGSEIVGTGPAGQWTNLAAAATTKTTAGIDSYQFRLSLGDWCLWLDTYNQETRLVSPQAFISGMLVSLPPSNSALNKPLQAIVGTQKSNASQVYSEADLGVLVAAGIDVIANPCPGGAYFGSRIGHNTSSNPMVHSDNYPRMTNYIAASLNASMGLFVGDLENPTLLTDVESTLGSFFENMWEAGLIGNSAGTIPYSVECDVNDNPQTREVLGWLQADVLVQYLNIAERFLINVTGGGSVQITSVSVTPLT